MKERMNETYSILGDSWLEKGTKTSRCVSVKVVVIMKCSGPFIPGYVSLFRSLSGLCVPSPLSRCRHRAQPIYGMIQTEPFRLECRLRSNNRSNVRAAAEISRWFRGEYSAATNCVGGWGILVQNDLGCDVCHLCHSFLIPHYMQMLWEGFRLPLCTDYMSLLSPKGVSECRFGELKAEMCKGAFLL